MYARICAWKKSSIPVTLYQYQKQKQQQQQQSAPQLNLSPPSCLTQNSLTRKRRFSDMYVFFNILCDRLESDEEAGEQLIADIFGASDEEEEFVVRCTGYM